MPHFLFSKDFDVKKSWQGAVCVLFCEDSLLFIKRSLRMRTHAGQVAFIGGHREEGEVDPVQTAKREFSEETGLDSNLIHFLGYLTAVSTTKERCIIPVGFDLKLTRREFLNTAVSNGEWDECFFVQLSDLESDECWRRASFQKDFVKRRILFRGIDRKVTLPQSSRNGLLWGATAFMVKDLFNR